MRKRGKSKRLPKVRPLAGASGIMPELSTTAPGNSGILPDRAARLIYPLLRARLLPPKRPTDESGILPEPPEAVYLDMDPMRALRDRGGKAEVTGVRVVMKAKGRPGRVQRVRVQNQLGEWTVIVRRLSGRARV